MNKKYFALILMVVCLISMKFIFAATFAHPAGQTELRAQTCSAMDGAANHSFGGACDGTYPGPCAGDLLSCNDGSVETHVVNTNTYAGVKITSFNSSITDCTSVNDVALCYERWTGAGTRTECTMEFSANGGTTNISINSSCPPTTANPGVICTNITSLASWSCGNFFGASGSRAIAQTQLLRSAGTITLSVDVLFFNVTYSTGFPALDNITSSHNIIKGGDLLTITANNTLNGLNDSSGGSLTIYCDNSTTPNSTNTDCTGGTTTDSAYPYQVTCTFATALTTINNTEYCRVYNGKVYSNVSNISYYTDSTSPTTTIVSVAGDTTPAYFDNTNNGRSDILVNGESGMLCRWGTTDVVYSSMANECDISGIQANCSVNDAVTQGLINRYISCKDSLGNEQNTSSNLNVQFYLDYIAPTTTDNSSASIQVFNYTVLITESDNVDTDPTTYYCTSQTEGCNPTTPIDNGGTITYTSLDRGTNYLRYYSVDDAGNSQIVVNKTININRLPIFLSAIDDASTIKGGTIVTISANFSELDLGQEVTLHVCKSFGADFSGCFYGAYCNATSPANMSCTFTSESDSISHTWYAYIFDASAESASANPITGSYITDITSPTVTIILPENNTHTDNSMTFTITADEALTNAWYTLNNGADNYTMVNTSLYVYTAQNTSIGNGAYRIIFYANDSVGNIGTNTIDFNVDNTAGDTNPPQLTIYSPVNGTYYFTNTIDFNITCDEPLNWSGYRINGGLLTTLANTSEISWYETGVTLSEGQNNITFYANDSSTARNSRSKSVSIYVDLTNPSIEGISCNPNPANDSLDITCTANVSDNIGLDYILFGSNATTTTINSTLIDLSGINSTANYVIKADNTSVGRNFTVVAHLFDLSGRTNFSEEVYVRVLDDKVPKIENISYTPNTTEFLDPYVTVNVSADIGEDFRVLSVILQVLNYTSNIWENFVMSNNTLETYNASFTASSTDTWVFRINATDVFKNSNISNNYTLVIANETAQNLTVSVPNVKSITYANRAINNSLGSIYLNNTGDGALDFNVTLYSSSIEGRLSVNYTNALSQIYSVAAESGLNITLDINTTDLTSGLYSYTINISSDAGSGGYSKQLNIQTSDSAYLDVAITTYSSSVTKGQTSVEYVATITNLGTQDASGVVLAWSVPSEFSITSGSATRSFSSLPIGSSGTNTITIDVSSSATSSSVNLSVSGTGTNSENSDSDSKIITISDVPVTVVTTTSPGGGGTSGGAGVGGAGGAIQQITYAKEVEVVRGTTDSFEIEVSNKYKDKNLENVVLELSGFLSYFNLKNKEELYKYISVSPSKIDRIVPGTSKKFTITLQAPAYKTTEEHSLKLLAKGDAVSLDGKTKQGYTDVQNVKLYIQEVSYGDTLLFIEQAKKSIAEMNASGFNINNVKLLLLDAEKRFMDKKNKDAYNLSEEIIQTRELAFSTNQLLLDVKEALNNPKKTSLLTGEVIFNDGEINKAANKYGINYKNLITGNAIFASKDSQEVLDLANSAFERGDYKTANDRVKLAQVLLLLERKGNFWLFMYLYWHLVLIGMIIFSLTGVIAYRKYRKLSISGKIKDLDREEKNILEILQREQEKYFGGRISAQEYHTIFDNNNERISKIKKERLSLRNKRISIIKPEMVLKELESEKSQVESEIKKVQNAYYNEKKISQSEYNYNFNTLQDRLAEIEEERATISVMKNKKWKYSAKK